MGVHAYRGFTLQPVETPGWEGWWRVTEPDGRMHLWPTKERAMQIIDRGGVPHGGAFDPRPTRSGGFYADRAPYPNYTGD